MRLTKVRIRHFQSIQDSTEFTVGDVTCLVGKNESGKTALLKALYRVNPLVETESAFDVTSDYPRRSMVDYEDDVRAGRQTPANVVQATFGFEDDDIAAVQHTFGSACLGCGDQAHPMPTVTIDRGYTNETTVSGLDVNSAETVQYLVQSAGLPQPILEQVTGCATIGEMVETLSETEQTDAVKKLTPVLREISEKDLSTIVYDRIVRDRIPKFLYFDEYYQMTGQDNLDALRQRVESNELRPADHPLLGLVELAGLNLQQLTESGRTEALIAKLEAAEHRLTERVLQYWSQNQHLRMRFEVRPAMSEDPQGMTSGTNIWGRVENTKHGVSTPLGTRSRGFVWFFSFLAWYSQRRKAKENTILLLDEPGLSLHAKAQADLLRYFDQELAPHNQLIYTTHSPFMVDPARFERVRIVQDGSTERDWDDVPENQQGTHVVTDVLRAASDSLFPLQGALGYEICQTLFVGPNCLVVEGVSDLLYLQTMTAILQQSGRTGLNTDWTITPVGGADKVPTFVALIGARTNLNIAVLVDFQRKDQQNIGNLYKRKLLKKQNVLTYADFTEGDEADIEDVFTPDFYLALVNGAYESAIGVKELPGTHGRIARRLERHLEDKPLTGSASFNHYRPARYLNDNSGSLAARLTDPELDRFERIFSALNDLL